MENSVCREKDQTLRPRLCDKHAIKRITMMLRQSPCLDRMRVADLQRPHPHLLVNLRNKKLWLLVQR